MTIAGLTLTGADADKYILVEPTTTASITAATVTVDGITASDKVYDGTTAATIDTTNATFVGFVAEDDVAFDFTNVNATFDTKDVGTDKTVTVNGLALTGSDAGNYVITAPTTTASITAATVTVSGITASDKVYDGTTNASIDTTNAAFIGAAVGDDVAIDVTGATGTFDSKDVGTDKTVTVSGVTLTGADATNYVLTQPTTTASITAASLTVSGITASDKVYDGTTNATIDTTNATLSGVVAGDDVALDVSGATGTFDTKGVGTDKTVTISGLTLTGTDAGNYVITSPTTTASITAATVTVNGITASDKVYDGTTSTTIDTTNATFTGFIGEDDATVDFSAATVSFDTKDVGTGKTVTIAGLTLTGADAGNYILTTPTTTANITAAPLTVTGITASDKAFDGTTTAVIDTTNAALVGVVQGDDVTLDVTNAMGTFDTPNVGTGKTVTITGLTITGADSGNYTLTQPTTTASIT